MSEDWFDWPALPDLFPVSFPGVQTKRDSFLVDVDLDRLKARVADYFDTALSHEEIAKRYPGAMKSSSGFVVRDARLVRDALLERGGPIDAGFVRFAYRPFDNRWLYWEAGAWSAWSSSTRLHAACVRGEYVVGIAQHCGKARPELVRPVSRHIEHRFTAPE